MKTSCWVMTVVLAGLSISACGRESEPATRESSEAAPAAGATPGTPGTPGMTGMGGMGGMMNTGGMDAMGAQMQAQMRAMDTATPAQTQAMMPQHRQAVANMRAQLN